MPLPEAAPNDMGEFYWYSTGLGPNHVNISTTDVIGAGRGNTGAILAFDSNAPAARACKNYSGGGKTDWFLPSKDELSLLYENRALVDNMVGTVTSTSNDYHSSSLEKPPNFSASYRLNIETGKVSSGWSNGWVRPIRAF